MLNKLKLVFVSDENTSKSSSSLSSSLPDQIVSNSASSLAKAKGALEKSFFIFPSPTDSFLSGNMILDVLHVSMKKVEDGQGLQALEFLGNVLGMGVNAQVWPLFMGLYYVSSGEFVRAEDFLQQAVEDKGFFDARGVLAECNVVEGKYEGALRYFNSLNELLEMADCLVNVGDLGGAIFYANEVLRHDPQNYEAQYIMGYCMLELGEVDEAFKYIQGFEEAEKEENQNVENSLDLLFQVKCVRIGDLDEPEEKKIDLVLDLIDQELSIADNQGLAEVKWKILVESKRYRSALAFSQSYSSKHAESIKWKGRHLAALLLLHDTKAAIDYISSYERLQMLAPFLNDYDGSLEKILVLVFWHIDSDDAPDPWNFSAACIAGGAVLASGKNREALSYLMKAWLQSSESEWLEKFIQCLALVLGADHAEGFRNRLEEIDKVIGFWKKEGGFGAASLWVKLMLEYDPENRDANYIYGRSLLVSKKYKMAEPYLAKAGIGFRSNGSKDGSGSNSSFVPFVVSENQLSVETLDDAFCLFVERNQELNERFTEWKSALLKENKVQHGTLWAKMDPKVRAKFDSDMDNKEYARYKIGKDRFEAMKNDWGRSGISQSVWGHLKDAKDCFERALRSGSKSISKSVVCSDLSQVCLRLGAGKEALLYIKKAKYYKDLCYWR